jgi:hypothetical protein
MSLNQKYMTEKELKIRRFARNRVRKLRVRRLLVVSGYTTSIRAEDSAIIFSSVTDGWCFKYDIDTVKKLLSEGSLKSSLNRKHDKAINGRLGWTG